MLLPYLEWATFILPWLGFCHIVLHLYAAELVWKTTKISNLQNFIFLLDSFFVYLFAVGGFCISSLLSISLFQVDLLGDEVDSLLKLLEKIYIALNHYSPILKHYRGVSWIQAIWRSLLYFFMLTLCVDCLFYVRASIFTWAFLFLVYTFVKYMSSLYNSLTLTLLTCGLPYKIIDR